jgi:hypothetical protein
MQKLCQEFLRMHKYPKNFRNLGILDFWYFLCRPLTNALFSIIYRRKGQLKAQEGKKR